MYAIETKGLTRCFGPVQALSGLDLAVPEGALYALLGVNGAGKSTAIKILTGLLPPTGGEARVLGYDVTRQREEVKKRMSLCPQDTAVAPNLTVEENLMLLAGLSGARRQDARRPDGVDAGVPPAPSRWPAAERRPSPVVGSGG